jgi:endonuclease/exonuclease/phosphatase (EEP) superfamily protein YafD
MTSTKIPRALRPLRDGGRWGLLTTVIAVWAVVGLLVVAVAGRTVRAPPAALAVTVTFLPYLYALLTALLIAAWAAFPGRRPIRLALVALVLAAVSMWAPRWSSDRIEAGDDLRLMTWNVRRLWGGPDDGGDAIACVIIGIREQAPDVLTLLEVSANDVAMLSEKVGLKCVHHAYTADGGPKEGGLATCTRGDRWTLGEGRGQRFSDDEDWYYVRSEVQGQGRVLNVLAVHLFPYRYVARTIRGSLGRLTRGEVEAVASVAQLGEQVVKSQSDQSAALLDRVDKFHDPTLIGGDFNSTRDSALHAALRRKLADAWEHGGWGFGGTVFLFDLLPLRIDYLYATPEFRVRETRIPPLGCSDHRPVVSDLVLTR